MRAFALVSLVFLAACGTDLRVDHPFDGEVGDGGSLVEATPLEGDAGLRLDVDATSRGSQVFVDLDEARELKADEAFATNAWDLSFQRYEVHLNSGASSPEGMVLGLVVKDQDWASFDTAPATGFAVDPPGYLFNSEEGGWYTYDLGQHRLVTNANLFYVVRTSAGAYMKVRMLSYYDAAGTPAALSLEYAPINSPTP